MSKVLVLGATGMLGHIVRAYFEKKTKHETWWTSREKTNEKNWVYFDAEKSFSLPNITNYDYVINCIGIIKPYCKDNDAHGVQRAIRVNAQLPWALSEQVKGSQTKVIQIATDCVYSGFKGAYTESDVFDPLDVYGKTKSLGEVFDNSNFLNVRCSIIGPELKGKLSLLEWFLNQPEGAELKGFTHHHWNGITTLQFAQLADKIIEKNVFDILRKVNHTHHFVPNNTVNKFEMLETFKKVYNKNYKIEATDKIGPRVDRTLKSNLNNLDELFGSSTLYNALSEIKAFHSEHF